METQQLDRMHAACGRVVAIANGKGGVLKTSVAANVAGLAADSGMPVLLVDLDPQGNLSEDLGLTQSGSAADGGAVLFDAIARGRELVPSHRQVRPNLDLVAADPSNTSVLAAWLATHLGRDHDSIYALGRALAPLAPKYELVVLDLPPGIEELRRVALAAARYLVIPTQSDISSLKGMRTMAERFVDARQANPQLQLLGILLVLVPESAKAIREEVMAAIHDDFGGSAPVFQTVIRHALAPARDARKRGLLAHELEAFVPTKAEAIERLRQRAAGANVDRAVSSTAVKLAADWAALTEEILTRVAREEVPA